MNKFVRFTVGWRSRWPPSRSCTVRPMRTAAGNGRLRRAGPAVQGLARLRTAAPREWRARLHGRDIRAPPPGTGDLPRPPRRDRHGRLAGRAAGRSRLVRAEMNGLDFYIRVLQPWARDPAFYRRSGTTRATRRRTRDRAPRHRRGLDVRIPAVEGSARRSSRSELAIVPPLLAQAEGNLTGNARDLWVTGAGTMQQAGGLARRAREEDRGQRPGAQEGDRRRRARRPCASSPG